jgi:hypothetical protein
VGRNISWIRNNSRWDLGETNGPARPLVTRVSGGAIGVIMIFALLIAHSDWGIFFGGKRICSLCERAIISFIIRNFLRY